MALTQNDILFNFNLPVQQVYKLSSSKMNVIIKNFAVMSDESLTELLCSFVFTKSSIARFGEMVSNRYKSGLTFQYADGQDNRGRHLKDHIVITSVSFRGKYLRVRGHNSTRVELRSTPCLFIYR